MMMGGGILVTLIILLLLFLFIIAIVGVGFWLYRQNVIPPGSEPGVKSEAAQSDALEILRLRYARGDITREEFEQMREDLSQ